MIDFGGLINSCWRHTGGSWISSIKRWHNRRLTAIYYQHHKKPIQAISRTRPRRLSIPDGDESTDSTTVQESRLLNLPTEVRLLIWEHAFGGNHLAIFRKGHRLTHSILDLNDCPESDKELSLCVQSIENSVKKMGHSRKKLIKKKPYVKKLNVIALLQSCRQIYSEGINMLYSHNTFVFLQNDTLPDFRLTVLEERLKAIRSVHLHWQFRELVAGPGKWGFNVSNFTDVSLALSASIPNLEHLTVFIQGPTWLGPSYRQALSDLKCYSLFANPPKFFVVRLPRQMSDFFFGDIWDQDIDFTVNDPTLPFKVVRPPEYLPDQDVGLDIGWRHGELFFPKNAGEGSSEIVAKAYTVWTPMPPGLSWPCQQWK